MVSTQIRSCCLHGIGWRSCVLRLSKEIRKIFSRESINFLVLEIINFANGDSIRSSMEREENRFGR